VVNFQKAVLQGVDDMIRENGTGSKIWAVVLAGGQGRRMHTNVPKQYLMIHDKPVIYYSLRAFEDSRVDAVVLVCGPGEKDYCKTEIVSKYGFKKVKAIVEGGKERYHSVWYGLKAIDGASRVLIHDGARPLVTNEIIERNIRCMDTCKACVTAVRSKDTVKISDSNGFVASTPDRNGVWVVQTPQTFDFALIKKAYERLMADLENITGVTDDAMVVERMTGVPVKLVEGSYTNLKMTTPEDLAVASVLLEKYA